MLGLVILAATMLFSAAASASMSNTIVVLSTVSQSDNRDEDAAIDAVLRGELNDLEVRLLRIDHFEHDMKDPAPNRALAEEIVRAQKPLAVFFFDSEEKKVHFLYRTPEGELDSVVRALPDATGAGAIAETVAIIVRELTRALLASSTTEEGAPAPLVLDTMEDAGKTDREIVPVPVSKIKIADESPTAPAVVGTETDAESGVGGEDGIPAVRRDPEQSEFNQIGGRFGPATDVVEPQTERTGATASPDNTRDDSPKSATEASPDNDELEKKEGPSREEVGAPEEDDRAHEDRASIINRVTSKKRIRLDTAYRMSFFSGDTTLQHGAAVAVAVRIVRFLYITGGYLFFPPQRIEHEMIVPNAADDAALMIYLRLVRHYLPLGARLEVDFGRLGLSGSIGIAGTYFNMSAKGSSERIVPKADSGAWQFSIPIELRFFFNLPKDFRIFIASTLDIGINRVVFSLRESNGEQIAYLEPYRFQAMLSVGVSASFF